MKEQKGMTYTMLTFIMLLIIIIVAVSVYFIKNEIQKQKRENVKTEMLLIQGKVKGIADSSTAKKDPNVLKGEKISEKIDTPEYQELLNKSIISKEEKEFEKYYKWDKQILEELGITIKNLGKTQNVIVNYETEEIILITPITIDGEVFYKLSEIQKYEEQIEKERAEVKGMETPENVVVNSEPEK